MRTLLFVTPFAALCATLAYAGTAAENQCQNLKSLSLPGVEFTAVEIVAAGPYQAPAGA
ncbi:MAG TPA: hypothetical protein VK724_06235 [Bryobacteraceae bacterium]|nr:hypothetical protein [Bryobacteraceae bacterium]